MWWMRSSFLHVLILNDALRPCLGSTTCFPALTPPAMNTYSLLVLFALASGNTLVRWRDAVTRIRHQTTTHAYIAKRIAITRMFDTCPLYFSATYSSILGIQHRPALASYTV